jgi:hypothetical protein
LFDVKKFSSAAAGCKIFYRPLASRDNLAKGWLVPVIRDLSMNKRRVRLIWQGVLLDKKGVLLGRKGVLSGKTSFLLSHKGVLPNTTPLRLGRTPFLPSQTPL